MEKPVAIFIGWCYDVVCKVLCLVIHITGWRPALSGRKYLEFSDFQRRNQKMAMLKPKVRKSLKGSENQ